MALNVKQKLYCGAVKAACDVDPAINLHDLHAARLSAFEGQGFDKPDYEFWEATFTEVRGRILSHSNAKAASEALAPAPAAPKMP